MLRLRLLLAERRRPAATQAGERLHEGHHQRAFRELAASNSYARRLQDVGQAAPTMLGRGRIARGVGRLAVRAISPLLRSFAREQQQFNRASVGSLEQVHRMLEAQEEKIAALRRTLEPIAGSGRRRAEVLDQSKLFRSIELSHRFANSTREADARYTGYASRFAGITDILDVACGTGRFLEACRQAGVTARGIDLDADMVSACAERGLNAMKADALPYLAQLPDGSLGGVFSAQFIEHLSSQDLVELLETLRDKLRPGGRLLLETLNPECLQVIYRWFWLDPTHQRLVHPWLLQELLRSAGFDEVEIHMVPPAKGALQIPALPTAPAGPSEPTEEFNRATRYLNDLLYASTDYYVVATR